MTHSSQGTNLQSVTRNIFSDLYCTFFLPQKHIW